MRCSVIFCTLLWLKLFTVQSFNLAVRPNLIIREKIGRKLKVNTIDKHSSYFGYTIVLREKSVIIGAPRARTVEAKETGVIYKYDFESSLLKKFDFKNDIPFETFHSLQLNSTQQWLGGAMDGGSTDADPLIACAPQMKALQRPIDASSNVFMHGFCYWTNNTLDNNLSQSGVTWKISTLSDKGQEKKQVRNGRPDFMFGELGFSVHITPNQEEIIMGAPGINMWSGTTIHIDMLSRRPYFWKHGIESFTYKGYAVGSGYFEKSNRNKLYYVATVPRANQLLGQAQIYTKEFGVYNQVLNLAGKQYGELFGYCVLVDDVNGDGLDDILIGAPYRTVHGILEAGAVYMYINQGVKGQLNFKPLVIESPFFNRAHFGTTLSTLGDVNGDGYKDVAVGAPFADGGGAVTVYFGGPTGLTHQPRQILDVSDQFEGGMFGHGLSKGVDIDMNGFKDLAVGAPNADTVFVYRAYPVVKIIATLRPLQHLIPISATSLQYEICYSILTNFTKHQTREILLNLTVDAKEKRINATSFRSNGTFTASQLPKCTTYEDSLKFDYRYEFVPIVLELSYRLKHDAKVLSGSEFCRECAITDPLWSSSTKASIEYMHNSVDLQLESVDVPYEIILGAIQVLSIKYVITNVGEEAYNTLLTVKSSLNVPFAKLPPECVGEFDKERKVVCNIAKHRAFTGSAEIELSFDLSNVMNVAEMDITAFVSSTGEEKTPKNNLLSNTVKLITTAEIWIVETSTNDIVGITSEKQNVSISTSFEIQNNGPSALNFFHLITEFPIGYIDNKGVDQYFVGNIFAQLTIRNFVNPPLAFEKSPPISPPTLNSTEILKINNLAENRTMLLSCQSTDESNLKMLCALNDLSLACSLQPGQNMRLELSYDMQWANVESFMVNNVDNLVHVIMVNFKLSSQVNGLLSIKRHFKGTIFMKINKLKTWWIYLLAIIGGLLLLVLAMWLLKKRGFFKRLTKEEMEKNFKEKHEKARMREELDDCTAEMAEDVSVYDSDL